MDAASVTQLTAVDMEWRGRDRDQPGTETLPFPGKEGQNIPESKDLKTIVTSKSRTRQDEARKKA